VQGAKLAGKQGHLRLRLVDTDAGSQAGAQLAALVFAVAQQMAVSLK
jgi:hypothetical protein